MQSELFILPFNIGLWFILLYCVARCVIWFRDLSRPDKLRLQRGFFGKAFVQSLREIFMESLLHRKIFRVNPVLGYMHMSLAFGWFLLIVFGTIEADIFGDSHLNPPHKAIFFRFYYPEAATGKVGIFFTFLMDLLLAFILSGLLLAIIKRFRSRVVGLKKRARHTATDRVALLSLWLIFPARLLAESFTCAIHGSGGFLTGNLGALLGTILPAQQLVMPFWWLYSLALGTFFVLLPRTRYLHIPMELFLIFMRNSGIRTGDRSGTFSDVEIHSCSSCGICLNSCQMALSAGVTNIQPLYLNKEIRENRAINGVAFNCLMCGRCQEVCPVGLETNAIRMIQRRESASYTDMLGIWKGFFRQMQTKGNGKAESREGISGVDGSKSTLFSYLKRETVTKAEVAFFAGCMTHLTPSVIRAMESIFKEADVNYTFIDREKGVCCGRPLMLAGQEKEARGLINHNSLLIRESGAKVLVTPCPICYKVFSESYYSGIEVMHHSQYIDSLIASGRLRLKYTGKDVVWHDPCELGRGSGVYDEPRSVLRHIAKLHKAPEEEEMGVCCGGSLGNLQAGREVRRRITADAVATLASSGAATIATGCPLCKKTFAPASGIPVRDIAELVTDAFYTLPEKRSESKMETIAAETTGF
ncbi:MAG: (Fe-S)-binding protein [Bacteroidales bacterium]